MKTNLTQTPVSLSVQTVLDESPQAKTVKSTKRMQSSAQTQKHTDTQSRNNALLKKRILGEELLTSLGVTSQETLAAGAEQTLQLAQAATTVSDAPAQSTQPALSTRSEERRVGKEC